MRWKIKLGRERGKVVYGKKDKVSEAGEEEEGENRKLGSVNL